MAAIVHSGGGASDIEVSEVFKWFEDGVLDTSVCGGFTEYKEANGRNNISSIATDGYLRVWSTQSGYGQSRIYSTNYLPRNYYDYALVYVRSLSTLNNSYPLTLGTTTTRSTTQVANVDTAIAPNTLSGNWIAVPLVRRNASSSNHYFTFGLVGDCYIDKIYFVKMA